MTLQSLQSVVTKICKQVALIDVLHAIKFHLQMTQQCEFMVIATLSVHNINSKLQI